MPLQNPIEILKNLKVIYNESRSPDAKIKNDAKNKLAKAYIVHHDEENLFVRERVTQRLKQIMANYNASVERITFDKPDIQEWIDSLYDVPMFNPTKLVIASELYILKDTQLESLVRYLKEPSPEVVLLLLSSKKVDKRKKKLNSLSDYAVSCDSEIKEKGKDNNSVWIKGFAAERGKHIDDPAVEFLKARYEDDLARIEKEIEKASIYIGAQDTIRQKDIEYISTGVSNASVFDIYPHLASKNKKKLLEITYRLLEAGESPILINFMISSRIKKLLTACDIIRDNPKVQDVELAGSVGLKPYFVRDIRAELRNYKREELANMYKRCMNIDSNLKRARGSDKDLLISGVMKLIERR